MLYSDPESDIPFAKMLYSNDAVMQAFFDALSKDGILVMQLGESPSPYAAAEANTKAKNRAATTDLLARVGFQSIHTYEEVSRYGFVSLILTYNRRLTGSCYWI